MNEQKPYKQSIVLNAMYNHQKQITIPDLSRLTNLQIKEVREAVRTLIRKYKLIYSIKPKITKFLHDSDERWSFYKIKDFNDGRLLRFVNNVNYVKKERVRKESQVYKILNALYGSERDLSLNDLSRLTNLKRQQIISCIDYMKKRHKLISVRYEKEFLKNAKTKQMKNLFHNVPFYKLKNPKRALYWIEEK